MMLFRKQGRTGWPMDDDTLLERLEGLPDLSLMLKKPGPEAFDKKGVSGMAGFKEEGCP